MSASSSASSSYLSGSRATDNKAEFNIWNMIIRRPQENAFCMTCKFRAGAKIQRIRDTTVTRQKHHKEMEKNDDEEEDGSSSSTSELSQDWDDFDEAVDDLEELYKSLNSQSMSKATSSIITMSRRYSVNRPFSGVDADVVSDIVVSGTKSQKLYLKKCAEFQISPSKIFVKCLSTLDVNIGHQNIGPKGAEACAVALTQNGTVKTLHINDNAIGHRGAKYIAFMLRENRAIRQLNLADNAMGFRGARHLVNIVMELDKIERLDLSNNGFKDEDAAIFKQLLEETRHLQYLNLSHNCFREVGGQLLGEGISYNDSVVEMDLSWNHLRRDGAVGIAEGLMDNTSLKRVNLSWNGFGLEGCMALEKTLTYNTTLEILDLTNNRITRECVGEMVRGLARNSTIQAIILKFNPLTVDGVQDLLQFIADTPSSGIKLVDLGIQQIDPLCIARINEVHFQGREFKVIHGYVTGVMKSSSPELERALIEEYPALALIEYGKIMGLRLVDVFSSIDKNGSRTLDREEIKRGFKMAYLPFSEKSIDRLIEKLDVNHDGEIDFSELLTAQKEHKKYFIEMLEAEQSGGRVRVEDTPLWKIKTYLQKLLAEKMPDYNSFKRVADQIAMQVQRTNDEIEAKREAITRERASKPRKIRSRPTSAKPIENERPSSSFGPKQRRTVIGSANEIRHNEASSKDTNMDVEGEPIPPRMGKRNKSVQLPIRRQGGLLTTSSGALDEGQM